MGIELYILGIRKLKGEEVKELTGKTRNEMEKSKFFRQFFPHAPHDSWYSTHKERGSNKKLARIRTPVVDVYGETVYVTWEEILGYYWHKNPVHREQIDAMLEDLGDSINWDEEYHLVHYDDVSAYTDRRPQIYDEKEEIIAFLYG